ncbi:hypothetical protein CDL12_28950 [Handroanthus impetiginosus]|uniref:DYW domain-containing protein n=1 Tax=Handroanthus impetiginosus TaxID=429701 RepID=A0A2G9FZU9_9LAMI|nr:hypothetical protein CDL12_28950 [Handroanthus impetiginosus]
MRWPTVCTSPSSLARHCRALMRSCARHSDIDAGKKVHSATITDGLFNLPKAFLRNVILHMYAGCGDVLSARKMFDEIPISDKDTVDWTTLIDCYSRSGLPMDALDLFIIMRRERVLIDDITMVSVFSTCTKLGNSVFGIQGHVCMLKMGLDFCVKARNAAMDMYAKCGLMEDAKMMFDEMTERNVISWTVLLWGVLKWEGLVKGKKLFNEIPERNEIAWSIMIARYVENGFIEEAFKLLTEMVFGFGLHLNSTSLCSLLSACTQSGDVAMGKWVHSYALRATTDASSDVKFATSLLDMYAKCGRINSAIRVFNSMHKKNVITWNAMLGGLAMHGKGSMVIDMFDQMLQEAMKPNDVTFTAMLSACSHSGLVEEGRRLFYSLENVYGIIPSMENYACMVDLLGRSGHLEEAEAVIRGMPMRPNEVVLGSLLGACTVHRKHELGERLIHDLFQLYPQNTEHHVLLSNMYALLGESDKANSFRRDLRDRGIRKVPGISTMYIKGQVHQFSAGEKSHPRTNEIYEMLYEMTQKLKLAGYVPDTSSQILSGGGVDDANEEEKERALMCHSEKLAVCFGLITTKAGTSLYIFKNLRICKDCHSWMRLVSRIYGREIVVRDRNRFHSFKFGLCSCSDYW